MADMITLTAGALSVVCALTVIRMLLPTNAVIYNMDQFVRGKYLIAIVNVTYLKVCVMTFLNYEFFETYTGTLAYNSYAAIASLVYVVSVPAFYLSQAIIYKKELYSLQKKEQAIEFLKEEDRKYKEQLEKEKRKNKKKNKKVKFQDEEEKKDEKPTENQVAAQMINEKAKIIRNDFRAKTLFEEYNNDNIFQYGYMVQFCLTRIVYGVVIAKLHGNVDYQLWGMASISAAKWNRNALSSLLILYLRNCHDMGTSRSVLCHELQKIWQLLFFNQVVYPMTLAFTAIVGFQAFMYILSMLASFKRPGYDKAPVSIPPEVVQREPGFAYEYWEAKRQLQQERKRVMEGKDKKTAEEEKKREEELKFADDDQKAQAQTQGPTQPTDGDMTRRNTNVSNHTSETEDLESHEITMTEKDTSNDQSLSEIRASETDNSRTQRSNNTSKYQTEESDELERDESFDPNQSSTYKSADVSATSDGIPTSKFQNKK